MTAKKVNFGAKPKREQKSVTPDEWVTSGGKNKEETTRFTIDIPVDLHARVKSQCALKKVKMRDAVLTLLEKHFPA